ncbi:adenylate/guanylate cyclase domain-containing protein [Nocardioides antri]|uniref:Adenylate/guanylate cyclase domain-containing protein n=1 Tax=Nocardioides antri TaxID=2607659 RepID=A0A5B1LY16_9ACTN|nr:adenylate/guanylate cyclase domain-containing protein [Nocardioides antri]KAA1425875.1 adenylate/guanylate cyclase domain-containing protein [Nocardioides antri]
MRPEREVRYADSGGYQIAYEVLGDGPLDIVCVFEFGSSLDLQWENPLSQRFLRGLAGIGRLIRFDIRGTGLSERVDRLPPLEEWVEDIGSVMVAVGSERAALIGHGHAAQPCLLFAAIHPERTAALVTINGFARLRRASDYPWGYPPSAEAGLLDFMRETWGTGRVLGSFNPGMSEGPRAIEWLGRVERSSAAPRAAARKQTNVFEVDVRAALPSIGSPTLVVQNSDDPYVRAGHAHYLVDNIAGARYVELPGADHTPFISRESDRIIDLIGEFLAGTKRADANGRRLMTVAFTDIVDSTKRAAELGDAKWRGLLEVHESIASREVDTAGGHVVKFTGDGLLATFEGPARAVECLRTLGELLEPLGLPIRAGVHTGEVEQIGDDIGGLGVHIAARISALAEAGEVLTSSTVRDLVAGSGLRFEDRGERELKGVPGRWRVLAAVSRDG